MSGRILFTNQLGGSIEADSTRERLSFAWSNVIGFKPNDVGHDSRVIFDAYTNNGRPTAYRVRLEY